MPAGFLYVLINPSMPGLAKVGKTTRNPTDRVSELSAATGVPSPFMLAFQQPVAECDAAELWVHKELEREGFRHADNREFFNAPLHEIIQVVVQAANLVFDESNLNDSSVRSPDYEASQEGLAEELYNLGCAYQLGTDSVMRNTKKALEYFEQAAALGNAAACSRAASIYRIGPSGVRQDMEKALALLSKGVHFGNWWNEANIAEVFLDAKQEGAAQEHWRRFFERSCEEYAALVSDELRTSLADLIGWYGTWYCESVGVGELAHCVPDQNIVRLAEPLLKEISTRLSKVAQYRDNEFDAEFMALPLHKARIFVLKKAGRRIDEKDMKLAQIKWPWHHYSTSSMRNRL